MGSRNGRKWFPWRRPRSAGFSRRGRGWLLRALDRLAEWWLFGDQR